MRRLKNVADVAVQPELTSFARVSAVDEELTRRRLVEATYKIYKRGFSRSRLADDCNIRPLRDFQIEMLKNVFVAVRIFEGNVAEFDITVQRFPVFLFFLYFIAVCFIDLRSVRHVRFRFKKPCQPFDIDLLADKVRYHIDYPADRLDNAERV